MVDQEELAANERVTQSVMQRMPFLQLLVHFAREKPVARLARVLCAVHRHVGTAQQLFRGVAVLREKSDAHARADECFTAVDRERFLQPLDHLDRHGLGFERAVNLRQHDRILVPAQARHGIRVAQHGQSRSPVSFNSSSPLR